MATADIRFCWKKINLYSSSKDHFLILYEMQYSTRYCVNVAIKLAAKDCTQVNISEFSILNTGINNLSRQKSIDSYLSSIIID